LAEDDISDVIKRLEEGTQSYSSAKIQIEQDIADVRSAKNSLNWLSRKPLSSLAGTRDELKEFEDFENNLPFLYQDIEAANQNRVIATARQQAGLK
jgi:predicted  nucleic acid-binding Zn-ribbon protein